jgi:NAD(P)-dependent dehydrogenase (short-subunit alcohol dehydrogenase family)
VGGRSDAMAGGNMSQLESKTILVTGASSGLGLACARLAAERGARLVLVGRDAIRLRDQFPEETHVAIACDVAQEEGVRALAAALKAQSLQPEGWVLAAGVQEIRPLLMESAGSLEALWRTNVFGTLGLLAAMLKARLVPKGASIVLFSSAAARGGGAGLVSYAASKGALEAATHSLALELASHRIRVNALAPGVVRTPMSDRYMKRMTAAQIEALEKQHPLGFGTPEQVAGPALFLLSDDAQWITGTVLTVDGGLLSQ